MAEVMKARDKYTARFELDEDGYWAITVDGVKGCRSDAKTIAQGKKRIREALNLWIDEAAWTVGLEVKVALPASERRVVDRSHRTRAKAEAATEQAAQSTRDAVQTLLGLGLSTADAGEVLGLSKQRVHQVAHGTR